MSSNLPTGVSENDIPGNRPEDWDWDSILDWLGNLDISPAELRDILVEGMTNRKIIYDPPPKLYTDSPDV